MDKNKKHTIEVVVDRLVVKDSIRSRLTDSLETVLSLSGGLIQVHVMDGEDMLFSQNYACPEHNISIEELTPRMFSFNNPYGACAHCTGLGTFQRIDPELIVPNKELSIAQGAINASGWNTLDDKSIAMMYYRAIAAKYQISLDTPVKDLPKEVLDVSYMEQTKNCSCIVQDLVHAVERLKVSSITWNAVGKKQETTSAERKLPLVCRRFPVRSARENV